MPDFRLSSHNGREGHHKYAWLQLFIVTTQKYRELTNSNTQNHLHGQQIKKSIFQVKVMIGLRLNSSSKTVFTCWNICDKEWS
jgi:hypothetical protein